MSIHALEASVCCLEFVWKIKYFHWTCAISVPTEYEYGLDFANDS